MPQISSVFEGGLAVNVSMDLLDEANISSANGADVFCVGRLPWQGVYMYVSRVWSYGD